MNATQRASALEAEANLPALSQAQVESLMAHGAGFAALAAIPMALFALVPRLRRGGAGRESLLAGSEAEEGCVAAATSLYEPLGDGI